MGMMRDCQVVSSREGSREVMSGLIRLPSSQYHDVRSTASLLFLPVSDPPQMADVACASVPAQKTFYCNIWFREPTGVCQAHTSHKLLPRVSMH